MRYFPLIFLLGLLLGPPAAGQLRVYHLSGEAYSQSKTGLQRLRIQDVLPPAPLVLKPGCQLVLLNEQGRTVAYSHAGTVPYAAVQKAFTAAPANLTQSYLAYVARKMREQSVALAQQGNAPVGGVSRGEQPRLWTPADSVVLEQPEVTFQWVSEEDGPFLFIITDAAGSPVLQIKTPASTLGFSLISSPLQHNTLYYWSVVSVASPSGNATRRAFMWPDEAQQSAFAPLLPASSTPLSPNELRWQAQYRAKWLYEHIKL